MGFSAICFSHKYLLIRNISGKSEEIVQNPYKCKFGTSCITPNKHARGI